MIKFCLANHFDDRYRYQIEKLKCLDPLNDSAVVIVPEQYTLQAESELMALLNDRGLLHIEVLSFKRIVHHILQDTAYADKPPISELGKHMLLSEIIENHKAKLDLYAEAYKIEGFLDQLADMITDFRHQGIAADDFKKIKVSEQDSPLFDKKLTEIALIYDDYLKRLNDITFDEDALINHATQLLKEQPLFSGKIVVVSGFSSMTGTEQKLLVELARQSDETFIQLIVDRSAMVDDYARAFLRSLTNKLNESEYLIEENYVTEKPTIADFKSVFERTTASQKGITCLTANHITDELNGVFSDIVKNYQNKQYNWRDMAIVSNQLTNYYRPIKRLAEIYKIPIFVDARRPAITHYIVDFILSLLRAIIYNYRTRDVIKVIKTGFFELTEQQIWQIENSALAYDINGAEWFRAWPEENDLTEAVLAVVDCLKKLKDSFKKANSAKQKIDVLRQFLDDLTVLKRVADDVERLYDTGQYERSEELAQVYNIVDDVFYQVYAIGEQRSLSLERFYELLKMGFEKHEIGIIPQGQDYLMVGNIKRSRLSKLKTIYFVGMDEAAIPSVAARSTIFNDDEMTRLQSIGLERLVTQTYNYNEEVYKTYENILKSDAVNWYYSKATSEGEIIRPSLWFKQLSANQAVAVAAEDLAALNLDDAYAESILQKLAENGATPEATNKLATHFNSATSARKVRAFIDGRHYHNRAPKLDEALISRLYGNQFSASVSRLESYAACPYQHFISYGLRPKDEKEVDLDFIDIGDFYHKIIENVMNDWVALGLTEVDEKLLAEIYQRHYDAYLTKNYRFQYNAKNRYFALRLKGVLATSLRQVVEQLALGAFADISNEVKFANSADAAIPAINLYNQAGKTVNLRGVIDRLDVANIDDTNYLRIVDYKSSAKKLDVNEVLHGLQLQLMIYLNAACHFVKATKNKSVKPFGAFYFSVDEVTINDNQALLSDTTDSVLAAHQLNGVFVDNVELLIALDSSFADGEASKIIDAKHAKGGIKANRQNMTAAELEILKDYALLKAKQLAGQIYAGNIAIKPVLAGGKAPCTYCGYNDICRFDNTKTGEDYQRFSSKQDRAVTFAIMEEELSDELNA